MHKYALVFYNYNTYSVITVLTVTTVATVATILIIKNIIYKMIYYIYISIVFSFKCIYLNNDCSVTSRNFPKSKIVM